jgi:hypothetical protein
MLCPLHTIVKHSTATRRLGLVLTQVWLLHVCAADTSADDVRYLTGSSFQQELEKAIAISRSGAELRPFLRRLGAERRVAILIDRRIDPGTEIDLNLPPTEFREAIRSIAVQAGAGLSVVGDTVYIGPRTSTGIVRTLIALREAELGDMSDRLGGREFELARNQTFAWDDLERPADILLRVAQRYGLAVEGIEHVPHDLWAGATINGVTAVQALSLILIQFDLTFEWIDDARCIRVGILPDKVVIARQHLVRGITPEQARAAVLQQFPMLEFDFHGRTIDVRATVEQHEAIDVLARGGSLDKPDDKTVDFGPLARRRFERLRVVRQPLEVVLQTLKENGVAIDYDADALDAAGIDLKQKISIDINDATVNQLFKALCEPVGLRFQVRGETVFLAPAE